MNKRDILTPFGITIGFIMIILAILSNGGTDEIASFVDLAGIFIVIGGLIASMLVTFRFNDLKQIGKILKAASYQNNIPLPELIELFITLSERARREGILALENNIDEIEDPFIRKGILLVVDGMEPEVIKDVLEAEIMAMEDRHYKGRILFEKAGGICPVMGRYINWFSPYAESTIQSRYFGTKHGRCITNHVIRNYFS